MPQGFATIFFDPDRSQDKGIARDIANALSRNLQELSYLPT